MNGLTMNNDIIDVLNDDGTSSANRINLATNTIIIYDDINNHLAKEITDHMPEIRDTNKALIIKINSPGGYVSSTQAILSELSSLDKDIIVDITGICWSAAAFIALLGDVRRMSQFGSCMLHYPRWGSDEQSLNEHKNEIQLAQKEFDAMSKILLKKTNVSYAAYKKKMDSNVDWYLSAQECKKLGIIDEVY